MVAACFQHRAARCTSHFSSGSKNAQLAGNRCCRDNNGHGFAVLVVGGYTDRPIARKTKRKYPIAQAATDTSFFKPKRREWDSNPRTPHDA